MIPFTATGFFTQDYFGRRTLLMTGGSVMGASMLALAGVVASTSDGTVTGAKANVCVFFSESNRFRSLRPSQVDDVPSLRPSRTLARCVHSIVDWYPLDCLSRGTRR
jgi:hypothetical protein